MILISNTKGTVTSDKNKWSRLSAYVLKGIGLGLIAYWALTTTGRILHKPDPRIFTHVSYNLGVVSLLLGILLPLSLWRKTGFCAIVMKLAVIIIALFLLVGIGVLPLPFKCGMYEYTWQSCYFGTPSFFFWMKPLRFTWLRVNIVYEVIYIFSVGSFKFILGLFGDPERDPMINFLVLLVLVMLIFLIGLVLRRKYKSVGKGLKLSNKEE